MFLGTILAQAGYHQVMDLGLVPWGQGYRGFPLHTFYPPAVQAPEMDVVMGMDLLFPPTIGTNGKILFAVIPDYTVYFAILTKTVEHPIDRGPIDPRSQGALDHIMAQGIARGFEQLQNRCFRWCLSPIHIIAIMLRNYKIRLHATSFNTTLLR